MSADAAPSPTKKIILSCAQATGKLHLGNYFGAIKQWVEFIEPFDCYYGIVDQHAITVRQVPAELRKATRDTIALYIACGLDPDRCQLFVQSHVTGHTELAWVLACICPLGQLERMTQFKDKAARAGEQVNAGLLYYPVLMAADILLYNADRVPVGDDQKQHLELCRDLAIKFNAQYSDTFTVPEPFIPRTAARIRSLQDPEKKMSKSDENQSSALYLLDPPDIARKKIMSAVTDSGSDILARDDKPGISNLLTLLSASTNTPVTDLEAQFAGKSYAVLKKTVADAVIALIEPIQQRYAEITAEKGYLDAVMKQGAQAAQARAHKMLAKVYRKTGFVERVR